MNGPWQIVAQSWSAKAQRLDVENRRLRGLLEQGVGLMGHDSDKWTARVEDWIWEVREVVDV